MSERQAAPGDLDTIVAFVNTRNFEESEERLADAAGTAAWLRDAGLPEPARLTAADAARLRTVREALRAVLLHHNGEPLAPDAAATLAHNAPALAVEFDPNGSPQVVAAPGAKGLDAPLAELYAIVARAQATGDWERMKACTAHDCVWAFYDHSRNRSARWCAMGSCGNRAKARAYRERHRHGS